MRWSDCLVITRSRVWPSSCVAQWTCWFNAIESSKSAKRRAAESLISSPVRYKFSVSYLQVKKDDGNVFKKRKSRNETKRKLEKCLNQFGPNPRTVKWCKANLSICLLCSFYETNRFHVASRPFGSRSRKTLGCGTQVGRRACADVLAADGRQHEIYLCYWTDAW